MVNCAYGCEVLWFGWGYDGVMADVCACCFCSAVQDASLELDVNNMSPTEWRATFVGTMTGFCSDYYTYRETLGSQVKPFCLCSTDS